MQKIPLSKCFLNPEVEEAALRALRSGQYILGKECQAFEAELAAHTGTKHAVLGTSWTMIVYLLHLAQGLKPGDEVIVPSHTAFPTMEPLIHCREAPPLGAGRLRASSGREIQRQDRRFDGRLRRFLFFPSKNLTVLGDG